MTLRVFLRDVNIFSPNMLARGPPCSLTRRTESIHQSSRSNLPRLDHLKTRVLPPGESRIKSDPRLWKGRIVRTHAEFIVLDSTRKPPHRYNRGTQHLERFMIIGCVACRHHVSPPYDGFFVSYENGGNAVGINLQRMPIVGFCTIFLLKIKSRNDLICRGLTFRY